MAPLALIDPNEFGSPLHGARYRAQLIGAAILALTIGATSAPAHGASVDQAATAAMQKKMAAGKFEFSSLQEMCKSEAGWGMPVMMPEHNPTIDTEVERYQTAVAACNGLRGGNRDICVSRAGTPAAITNGMKSQFPASGSS